MEVDDDAQEAENKIQHHFIHNIVFEYSTHNDHCKEKWKEIKGIFLHFVHLMMQIVFVGMPGISSISPNLKFK